MQKLSNNYQDLQVWNLNPGKGPRGPFLVTQSGVAPGDDRVRGGLFVLRPDGKWVDITVYLIAEHPEQLDEAVFDSTQAIVELLTGLGIEAEVEDPPVSEDRVREWLARSGPGTVMDRLRQWVQDYRRRRRETGTG